MYDIKKVERNKKKMWEQIFSKLGKKKLNIYGTLALIKWKLNKVWSDYILLYVL